MITQIEVKRNLYKLPIYLPDATLGVVKSLGCEDMQKIDGVVVNTYHLMEKPGLDVLKKFGGIKNFMNYKGLVVSDSGGWQIFSLIHRHRNGGRITDEGVVFSGINGNRRIFSPEDSIKAQFEIGSDIIICLDDFTNPNSTKKEIEQSVNRTILWAKRSKEEFNKQVKKRKLNNNTRPYILGVVQGHNNKILRKYCAQKLIEISFDGYSYGGYPMDSDGNFDYKISNYVSKLLPEDKVKFALGIGTPWQIATLFSQGWNMFDCTIPTREARHQRLYSFRKMPRSIKNLEKPEFYEIINISKAVYKDDKKPISKYCGCQTCQNYSRAYLHHLFKIYETEAYSMATLHNLQLYSDLIGFLNNSQN